MSECREISGLEFGNNIEAAETKETVTKADMEALFKEAAVSAEIFAKEKEPENS